ncbi:MAG: type II toxin-antitoxin system ParD family antitoxin [Bryobacteraceae bacterium]
MIVHLTPEIERIVEAEIESGRYGSATEVIREALRLLRERDELVAMRKVAIREQIGEGWRSAERGELVDGDEVPVVGRRGPKFFGPKGARPLWNPPLTRNPQHST